MANWYILRNGQPHGPYAEDQIKEWMRSGQIAADEKLNREGDSNWLSLDMIPEFAAERAAHPLPPPPLREHLPWLAMLLSFICCGIGQIYNKQTTKGVVFLVVDISLWVVTYLSCGVGLIFLIPARIVGMVDALLIANKIAENKTVGEWEFF